MVSKDCLEWLMFAKMDISAAHQLFEKQQNPRHRPTEIILYHCQQGAEKALKSFIVQNSGALPPKTHELQELRLLCRNWDIHFDSKRLIRHCAFLDPFAIIVRYPQHSLSLDSGHAVRGIRSAKRTYDFVCNHLGLQKTFYQ